MRVDCRCYNCGQALHPNTATDTEGNVTLMIPVCSCCSKLDKTTGYKKGVRDTFEDIEQQLRDFMEKDKGSEEL